MNASYSFNRSHPKRNKVVIEAYRALIAYASVNRRFRVGVYLFRSFYSEFFDLQRLIKDFELFEEVASTSGEVSESEYPQYIKEAFGPTFQEQVQDVWLLRVPISAEIESKSFLGEIFGYKFKNPVGIVIQPDHIESISGRGVSELIIQTKSFVLEITFGTQIKISSPVSE